MGGEEQQDESECGTSKLLRRVESEFRRVQVALPVHLVHNRHDESEEGAKGEAWYRTRHKAHGTRCSESAER